MDLGLAGRTAFVAASSQGLGYACARSLAREGVAVTLNGRDEGRLVAAAAALRDEVDDALATLRGNGTLTQISQKYFDTDVSQGQADQQQSGTTAGLQSTWELVKDTAGPMALARGYGGQVIAATPDGAMSVAITSDPTLPARSEGYFGDLLALVTDRVMVA